MSPERDCSSKTVYAGLGEVFTVDLLEGGAPGTLQVPPYQSHYVKPLLYTTDRRLSTIVTFILFPYLALPLVVAVKKKTRGIKWQVKQEMQGGQ